MRILNISFAYLFWLANNKTGKYPEYCMGYSGETWYVGSSELKCYPFTLSSPMHMLNSSFAYLFWLANNKKGKYPGFYVDYSNETWCVGSSEKYYPCALLL